MPKDRQELLVGRQRCARELQQLWEDLDVREKALEEAALEAGCRDDADPTGERYSFWWVEASGGDTYEKKESYQK